MTPEVQALLERIRVNAQGLGDCNDAADHGSQDWAEKNAPRFIEAIDEALHALPPPYRNEPDFVRWRNHEGGSWVHLVHVVRRLFLPAPEQATLRQVRRELDAVEDDDAEPQPSEASVTARANVARLLATLSPKTQAEIQGVRWWSEGKSPWGSASDSLWCIGFGRPVAKIAGAMEER